MLGITNEWTAQPCQHNVVSCGEPPREVLPKSICSAHMEAADFATSYWEQGQPNNFPTSNHQVNFAIFQGYGICCITDHFGHLVEDLPGNKSWKHLRKRGRPNQSLLVLVPSFVLGRCFQRLQPRFLPNLCCSPFENTAIQLSPTWNVCHPLHFPILLNPLSLSLSGFASRRLTETPYNRPCYVVKGIFWCLQMAPLRSHEIFLATAKCW